MCNENALKVRLFRARQRVLKALASERAWRRAEREHKDRARWDSTRKATRKGLEQELDALFAAYREACPDPDPAPTSCRALWQQIEARRSVSYVFRRWTQAFVTAAAALCLLLGLLRQTLTSQPSYYTRTYLEVLQEESAADNPFYVELLGTEDDTGGYQ